MCAPPQKKFKMLFISAFNRHAFLNLNWKTLIGPRTILDPGDTGGIDAGSCLKELTCWSEGRHARGQCAAGKREAPTHRAGKGLCSSGWLGWVMREISRKGCL